MTYSIPSPSRFGRERVRVRVQDVLLDRELDDSRGVSTLTPTLSLCREREKK